MKKSKPVPSARLIIQQGKASPFQKAAWRKLLAEGNDDVGE